MLVLNRSQTSCNVVFAEPSFEFATDFPEDGGPRLAQRRVQTQLRTKESNAPVLHCDGIIPTELC